MKIRLKLTFLSLLITVMVNAQGIYNNGGKIVIGSGAVVHINGSTGNLRNETSGGDGAVLLSGTLRLGGNLTNNVAAAGVFTTPVTGSEVILNGSAAQTLGGSSTATLLFDKLTLNNSNGVTMGSNVQVNNLLSFQNGIITTGLNILTIGLDGSVSGASSGAYVNGKLARVISVTGSDIAFPLGKGGNYRPLSLNFSSLTGTSTVLAEQLESLMPGTPPVNVTFFDDRYWKISQSGGTDFSYKLTLNAEGFSPSGTKKMIKGDSITNIDYNITYSSPNYTNTIPFTSFSNFGVGEYCLPQLVTFETIDAKTWGDAPFTVSATGGASGNPVIFSSSDTTIASCEGANGNTINLLKAGFCTISAIQAGDTTYCEGRTDRILTIHPKPITVLADTGQSKIYGSSDPTPFTFTLSPSLLGLDTITGLMERNTGENVNSYDFKMGTLDAGSNYTLTLSLTPVFTIKPKPLTPVVTANDKCYDGSDTATLISQTLTGVIGAEDVSLSVSSSVFADSTAGTAKTVTASGLSLGGAGASNYVLDTIIATTTADIFSLPVPVITGSASVCIGSTGNVYSTETGKTAYVWTVSAGGSITAGGGSADSSVTVTWNTSGAQSISVNYTDANSCSASTATEKAVNVSVLPVPALSGPETACKDIAGQIYSTDGGMSNYVWNVSAGGEITAGGASADSSVTVTWNTSGAQSVSINYTSVAGCLAVSATEKDVSVISSPVPTVAGPATVCSGVAGSKYITQAGQSNYNWSVSAGGTVTAGGTSTDSTATVTWNDSGDQTVSVNYENSDGCEGVAAGVQDVYVKPLPVPAITGEIAVCESTGSMEYTTEAGKSAYTWTLTSGGTINDGLGTNSITISWDTIGFHDVTVIYTDTAGCTAATPTIKTVGVGPLPVVGLSGPDTACVTHPDKVYSTEPGKTNYVWSISSGGTITAGGTATDNTLTVTWDTIGVRTVSVNYDNEYGCNALSSTVKNVTALAPPIPTVSGSDTICSGDSGNIYTTQAGKSNYTWTVSAGGTITSGGDTSDNTVTVTWDMAGDESVSVNYQNSNGCEGVAAGVQNVYVLPGSVGGSVSGSENVCSGTNSTVLTLSGHSGKVLKWQLSTNNWTNSTDVSDTTSTLTASNLTITTKYRAVVQSGECSSANSTTATVSVFPLSVGGSVFGSDTVCSGINSTILSLSGYTGTVVKWQKSTDNWVSATDVSDTTATLIATDLTATTKYRAVVQSGPCSTANSSDATVTIRDGFIAGSISATDDTICYGGDPENISSLELASGGDNSILYKWQISTSSSIAGFTDIISATDSVYNPQSGLTTTSWFRRLAMDESCAGDYTASDGVFQVNVRSAFSAGSILADGETICYNGDPAKISNLLKASGGDGLISYQWQSSTTNGTSGFSNILGANDSIYNPPGNVTDTIWYRRMAKDETCNIIFAASDGVWKISIETEKPTVQANDLNVYLDADGTASITANQANNGSTDNCSIASLGLNKYDFGCDDLGDNTVILSVTDSAGNADTENFTVHIFDTIHPVAIAKNITIYLDPYGNASLTGSAIDDGCSDNCSYSLSVSKSTFNCSNLGANSVTLTVTDGSNNTATDNCIVTVEEGGELQPPWMHANTNSSANGTVWYSYCTNDGTYRVTSKGVSTPTNDVMHFVYQQLCGNGTVIVRLSDIASGGWAGVMMRESNASGAKTVLFKTKLYNPIANIGVRSTTNGNISNTTQNIPNIHWMKIQRTSSNTFKIYTSYDGTTWIRRYTATVAMNNCINVGFFTENAVSGRTTTAWIDHAEVVAYLKDSDDENVVINTEDAFEVMVYPNPATDKLIITIPENTEKVKVTLINAAGLVVETSEFNTMDVEYYIKHIKPGIYLLRFERNGIIVNKRLVVL
jgi:hypothetical protein